MVDSGIGRLLIASLHQAIAEIAPTRLDFYEHWLTPGGLRDGRMGLAPFGAVLSFLRREGQETYQAVMTHAGTHSAEWTVADIGAVERRVLRTLPSGLRARAVLGVGRRLVRASCERSRATVRLRRGSGTMEIRDSVFCTLREAAADPMCGYYAAAVTRLFALFQIDADVSVRECRASGGAGCTLDVTVRGALAEPAVPAEAA
ncbi:MAG: hypothetical protein AB7O67_10745 [Vicinamibacterales bacterium]